MQEWPGWEGAISTCPVIHRKKSSFVRTIPGAVASVLMNKAAVPCPCTRCRLWSPCISCIPLQVQHAHGDNSRAKMPPTLAFNQSSQSHVYTISVLQGPMFLVHFWKHLPGESVCVCVRVATVWQLPCVPSLCWQTCHNETTCLAAESHFTIVCTLLYILSFLTLPLLSSLTLSSFTLLSYSPLFSLSSLLFQHSSLSASANLPLIQGFQLAHTDRKRRSSCLKLKSLK